VTSPKISPLAPRQLSEIQFPHPYSPSSKFAASQSSSEFTATTSYHSGYCRKTILTKENRSPLGPLKNTSRGFASSNIKCLDIGKSTRKSATVATPKHCSSKSPALSSIYPRFSVSNTPRNYASFETPKTVSHDVTTARKRKMSIHGVMSIKRNWESQKQREKGNLENNFELAKNLSQLVENDLHYGSGDESDSDNDNKIGLPKFSLKEQNSPITVARSSNDFFASPNSRENELMNENEKLRLRINELVTVRNSLLRKLQDQEVESKKLQDRLEKSENRCTKMMKSIKERSSNENKQKSRIYDIKDFSDRLDSNGRRDTGDISECEPYQSLTCSNGSQFNLDEHRTELLQIMGLSLNQNSSPPEATPEFQRLREKYDSLMTRTKEVEGKLAFAEADAERSARYYEHCLAEQTIAHNNEIATRHETINSLFNEMTNLQLELKRFYHTQGDEVQEGSAESTVDGPHLSENDMDIRGSCTSPTFHSESIVEYDPVEYPNERNDLSHNFVDNRGRQSFGSETTTYLTEEIAAKMLPGEQAAMDDSFSSHNSEDVVNYELCDFDASYFDGNCGRDCENDSREESRDECSGGHSTCDSDVGSRRNINQSPISEYPNQMRISRAATTTHAPPTSSQIEVIDLTRLIKPNDRVRVLLKTPNMFDKYFEEWHEAIVTKVTKMQESPSAFVIFVQYEDGEEAKYHFPCNDVQLIEEETEELDSAAFSVGDLVQCRVGDGAYEGRWYRGRVASVNKDGNTCDIMYYTNKLYESNVPIDAKNVKRVGRDCCGEWLIDQKVRRTRKNGCHECGFVKDVETNDFGKFFIVDFDGGERSSMRYEETVKAAFQCLLDTYSNEQKLQWPALRNKCNNDNNNKNKQKKTSIAPSKRKRKTPKQADTEQNSRELPRRERRKPDYFALASSSV